MANDVVFGGNLGSVKVNDASGTHTDFDSNGYAEIDLTDTDQLAAVQAQGAVVVDKEGTEEALDPGNDQTADTLSALVMRNDSSASVINVLDGSGGDVVVGPLNIASGAERVIVFPEQLEFEDVVHIEEDTGGLDSTTPGFLIP